MELTLGSSAVRSGEAVTCSASAVVSAWYDRYGTDVLRLCYMYMRNRSDAEDALQETFLKIWRKLDCYEGRNHCTARSWIMKVARNTCMDLLRNTFSARTTSAGNCPWRMKTWRPWENPPGKTGN